MKYIIDQECLATKSY